MLPQTPQFGQVEGHEETAEDMLSSWTGALLPADGANIAVFEFPVFPVFSAPFPFLNAQPPPQHPGLDNVFPEIYQQALVNGLNKNEQQEPIVSEVELFASFDGALDSQAFLDLEAPLELFSEEPELRQLQSSPLPPIQPSIEHSSPDTLGLSSQTLSISPKTATSQTFSASPKTVASKTLTLSPTENPTSTTQSPKPTQEVQFLQYDPAKPTKRTPKAARPHNGRPPTTEKKPRSVQKRKNVLLETEVQPCPSVWHLCVVTDFSFRLL
ncbi:hypothetical protein QBC41DRAFT_43716 [Cercophora samala]|uniref:Uncharacterized protein n=1 Tax=Cercophora samala TaxID=330535 RepID=A0AA39YWZ8_9PEZI|nr:hypothetical protein QBC41DRAFT_43716 [Cercophora samala]